MTPYVSVLLPVYNGMPFLKEAIESILCQTFTDFEIILIDDGSKDDSFETARSYNDPRIRCFQQKNIGLAATLNVAASYARGFYLARQDQDDISLPTRLSHQVEYLDSHKDTALVGTWAEIFTATESNRRYHRHPSDPVEIAFELLFNNPIVHSSVMMRKSTFHTVGGYSNDKSRQPPEDFELWSRINRHSKIANIPIILHRYREIPSSMSRDGFRPFAKRLTNICAENMALRLDQSTISNVCLDTAEIIHGFSTGRHITSSISSILQLLKALAVTTCGPDSILAHRLYVAKRRQVITQMPAYATNRLPQPLGLIISWLINYSFLCMHIIRRIMKRIIQ